MRYDDPSDVPDDGRRSVVCIGVFDGVHRGHRAVLSTARDIADASGARVVAVTFDPHPSAVVRPDTRPLMLSTVDARVALLEQAGADDVLVLAFTLDMASWTPAEFVDRVLVSALRAEVVVVGEGFRFGHRAAGDVPLLEKLGAERQFIVSPLAIEHGSVVEHGDAGEVAWSSTYVRQCVLEGDVVEAARALTRPHRVEGVVVHGDHRGRDLGYPTANLEPVDHAAIPADGVYAGWLVRHLGSPAEERLPAAISIGTNPTFDGTVQRVEAYVLDRHDLDLYGEHVGFDFVERLRRTLKFDGIDSLVTQMADDVEHARRLLV